MKYFIGIHDKLRVYDTQQCASILSYLILKLILLEMQIAFEETKVYGLGKHVVFIDIHNFLEMAQKLRPPQNGDDLAEFVLSQKIGSYQYIANSHQLFVVTYFKLDALDYLRSYVFSWLWVNFPKYRLIIWPYRSWQTIAHSPVGGCKQTIYFLFSNELLRVM